MKVMLCELALRFGVGRYSNLQVEKLENNFKEKKKWTVTSCRKIIDSTSTLTLDSFADHHSMCCNLFTFLV